MARQGELIPPLLKRVYEEEDHFHDWYLFDLYVANTGKLLLAGEGSKRGYTTVQFELTVFDNESYVIQCVNVTIFRVSMRKNDEEISLDRCYLTSFGCCYEYKIECTPEGIRHELVFEAGARILIISERVKCKKVANNFIRRQR